jgi:hypothetical protein
VFGFVVTGEDKANETVRLGITKTLVSLHHKSPTSVVDHFAIGIEKFNKESVTQNLKQRGITPEENIDAGFHIKDPAGINVQIVQAWRGLRLRGMSQLPKGRCRSFCHG